MKWTLGKPKTAKNFGNIGREIRDERGRWIIEVYGEQLDIPREEMNKHAYLVWAAPQLLAACQAAAKGDNSLLEDAIQGALHGPQK